MAANFPHSRTVPAASATAPAPGPAPRSGQGVPVIDWSATSRAERACCCLAKPVVVAAVLASAGRAHPTELLLCGHHYRASMAALAAVRATVLDFDGTPVTDEAWHLTSAA